MKIMTDHLSAADLQAALRTAELAPDVILDTLEPYRTRMRAHGYEAHLAGLKGTTDRNGKVRKAALSNRFQPGSSYRAATYDDWGWWLAVLFERDPEMIAGPYKGADHFHELTRGAFRRAEVAS